MKRYFIYITMVVAALFASCTTDVTDTPEMKDVGNIEVTFSVDGQEVRALELTSVSHTIKVDVTLNNDDVYWTPVSSQSWCQIVEETHRGTGSFTIVINANDSFEARERAEITFKAGEYSMPKLAVVHDGNVFVMNQVYAAATKSSNSALVTVSTLAETEWRFESDDWIDVVEQSTVSDEEQKITTLQITWSENTGASRYGAVRLYKSGRTEPEGWFNIWQYGTDVNYDESGNILLGAQDAAPLELRVPKQTIGEINMPTWVSYELVENDDTASYFLQFADNPSDAKHIRKTELSLSMLSGAADVAMPVIMQEYYDMEGLLTGPGLALFAKTWNEGGDVSQWYIDGVPTLIDDIDLTEIKEWVSIGTAERPWQGEFNGNGKKIINLKATQPLFGYCEDALIKSIIFDESSKFSVVNAYSEGLHLATLAGSIKNTTVESCTNNAMILLEAGTTNTAFNNYIGGLVGEIDATSKLSQCTNIGTVKISSACTSPAGESAFYIGGLVGYNNGIIEDSFNNGYVENNAQVRNSYMGGIAGYAAEGGIIRNNLNAGSIQYGGKRGNSISLYSYVGGVAGFASGELSGNTNDGDLTAATDVQTLHIGGIAGILSGTSVTFKNNTQANASDIDHSGKGRHTYIGGLVGYVDTDLTLDYTTDSGTTNGNVSIDGVSDGNAASIIAVGGLLGYCSENANVVLKSPNWDGKIFIDVQENLSTNELTAAGVVGYAVNPITITGATTAGEISLSPVNFTLKLYNVLGGIIGIVADGLTLSDSTNSAEVAWTDQGARLNGAPSFVGGLVGWVKDGNTKITSCHNRGVVHCAHYNNHTYNTNYTFNATGGIIGSYGGYKYFDSTCTLEMKDCTNINKLNATRGIVGGIAGFVRNATIDGCSFSNGSINEEYNAQVGGIVAIAEDTTIKNCSVKTDISGMYTGSLQFRGGGIVGHIMGVSLIDNCEFFGSVTRREAHGSGAEYYGGIAGWVPDEDTTIKNSRYGGVINGVEITETNFLNYIINVAENGGAASPATVINCSYWNGK